MEWGKRKDGQAYPKDGKGHGITSTDMISEEDDSQNNEEHYLSIPEQEIDSVDDLGLSYTRTDGYHYDESITQQDRKFGNEIIHQIVNMEKRHHPELRNYKIDNTNIYNDYDTIQKTLLYSDDIIQKLIEWRDDGNPKTWKWISPIVLKNNDNDEMIKVFDSQNHSWKGDAYKRKVVLTMMSPEDFLNIVSPETLRTGRNDIRGEEFTKETTDELTERMLEGKPVDTVYIIVDKNKNAISHEGQHRALSAIRAGIKEIPVYVYANGSYFTNSDMQEIVSDPVSVITPDE